MRIPDRWLDYSRLGERITSTPFICFKTPLHTGFHQSRHFSDGLVEEDQFSPQILLRSIRKKGFRLAAVIDLTNTFRYYNGTREFLHRRIGYEKLKCMGHCVPSEDVYQDFCDIVSTTLSRFREGDKKLIGVHCTHGVNRTGYLVCRYLIEYFGFEPEDAIRRFNEARGHDLERENYLEDLKQRKGGAFNVLHMERSNVERQGDDTRRDRQGYDRRPNYNNATGRDYDTRDWRRWHRNDRERNNSQGRWRDRYQHFDNHSF